MGPIQPSSSLGATLQMLAANSAADDMAIDFKALFQQERKAMRERLKRETMPPNPPVLSHKQILDLDSYRVASSYNSEEDSKSAALSDIFYVPNFISDLEGKVILKAVDELEPGANVDEARTPASVVAGVSNDSIRWVNLTNRRLMIVGGTPDATGMVQEPLPPFLQSLCTALVEAGVFSEEAPPNHILINEYLDGQGIKPHKDGSLYDQTVAIVSVGSEATLMFWPSLESSNDISAATSKVNCEHCSLVVFKDAAYTDLYHGIPTEDTSGASGKRRVSFTVRRVLNLAPPDSHIESGEGKWELARRAAQFRKNVNDG